MMTKQDFGGAEAYIARADRLVEKHRGLIGRSHNQQNVATARDLINVLLAFRDNVERRRRGLQGDAYRQGRVRGGD
jgi:hypothetical protein